MRQRFKIFDSDTHLAPNVETLEPYFDANIRKRLPEWESFKIPFRVGWTGEILEPPYRHRYQFKKRSGWRQKLRILGEASPREEVKRHHPKFMGSRFPTPGVSDDNFEARIRDMDEEGVDVQLMLPGTPPASDDVEIEVGFIRANHRFTNDFCTKYPHRLKSLIVVSNKAVGVSVEEIKTWARAPWVAGIYPHLDEGFPIDHPDLEPIWAAAN
ncbi:MAG: amidohydrolase family protein, partial [Candidatus Binatia bacterium]